MCQTAYPPQAARCRDAGECERTFERQCALRVGACAWEARLPLGGGGERLLIEPPGLQVESEDLWLAVSLSPSPGGGGGGALRLPPLPSAN